MEKELFEKLQLIAEKHGKTSDLQTYVLNGNGMCLNEQEREIKFNHISDKAGAQQLVEDIICVMKDFHYAAELVNEQKHTYILYEYKIRY